METFSNAPMEVQNPQQIRTYEVGFDQAEGLRVNRIEDPAERALAIEQFYSYISAQMETTIGERYNVGLSQFSYDIKDGQMWGKDMNEPFMDSLTRGRDYRKVHGKAIDWAREDAEVAGFKSMQSRLLSDKAKVGDTMLSISIRGAKTSTYQRNFYDVFSLRESDLGERYIEARRYASALGPQDYKEKLGVFGRAEDYLASPIEMPSGVTPDDIHAYLHDGHEFMNGEDFGIIKNECRDLIRAYTKALVEQPGNDTLHKVLFNTIINKADDISEKIKNGQYNSQSLGIVTLQQEVEAYGFQPVKEIETGCGTLGGYDVRIISPFGVAEYASDIWGERTFNCPSCKKENIRPVNQRIPFCQHCGSSDVAC